MTLKGVVQNGMIVLQQGATLPEGTCVEVVPDSGTLGELARKADIKHLSALLQQLNDLKTEPERDDYGILRVNQEAYAAACGLLIDTAIVSALEGCKIPYGCVSTDSEGGVRIEWTSPTSSVRLVVPPSEQKQGYVYHEEGTKYSTEAATPEALARWLRTIKE
jgi:hypothetical protein